MQNPQSAPEDLTHRRPGAQYHCALDLDYVLRAEPEEASSMLRDAKNGRGLAYHEVQAHAAILKARGFEVMPVGCDRYDARGYCMGHPSLSSQAEAPPAPPTASDTP